MKTNLTARNLELSERLRGEIERKLTRLDRKLHPESEANVELIAHASHAAESAHVAEVTLVSNGHVMRSTSAGATPMAAFDGVLDKLERQIVRTKERPRSVRERRGDAVEATRRREGLGTVDAPEPSGVRPHIEKFKRFDMLPMFEEDAITRMDELGHAFFVFLNAETDAVAVLYRRSNGSYGLIEPVLGNGRSR